MSGPAWMECRHQAVRGFRTDDKPAGLEDLLVEWKWVAVSDFWFQVGEVPLGWPFADRLEVNESRGSVDDEDVESVWRAVQHLLGWRRLLQLAESASEGLLKDAPVGVLQFGCKVLAVESRFKLIV
jgi:hypothetical protein